MTPPSGSNAAPPAPGPRYGALDGARGLAALAVVLCHCMSRVQASPGSPAEIGLKAFLTLGHTSVVFFFVLSGFVLSIRFFRPEPVPYCRFQMGRVARLYPCFFLTLVLGALVQAATPDTFGYGNSGIFYGGGQHMLTFVDFLRQASLIGLTAADINLNGPSWSMIYELRAGLFIPLLCWPLGRLPLKVSVAACLGLLVFSSAGLWALDMPNPPFTGEGSVAGSAFVTLHYLVAFHIGCIASRIHHAGLAERVPPLVLLLAALVLLGLGTATHSDLLLALQAGCLILAIPRVAILTKGLTSPPCAFLGHISYSLYLVHFTVLMGILRVTEDRIGQVEFVALSLALAIPAATLIWRFVEVPSIQWSRAISRPRGGRRIASPAPAGG